MDEARRFLRHTLATIAYRGGKTLRDAPEGFSAYQPSPSTRSPGQILSHMGDLFDWALSMAKGAPAWNDSATLAWPTDVERFFAALGTFDAYLASDAPLHATPEQLFQGPIADSLTHIGQLAILRRLHGAPIRGENYYKADIAIGRVGAEQAQPRREF
jgi:hypothetical protein